MTRLFLWSVFFYGVAATVWAWFGPVAGILAALAILAGTLVHVRNEIREIGDAVDL